MTDAPQSGPQDLLAGKRALLVDDDPHLLGLLRHILKKKGVECLEANNGLRGLEVLAAEKVHFILSDINMPEMDGFEFLTAVRKQPQFEILPFVLLTGRPAYSGLQSGLGRGADSYLPKPFDEQTILDTINNCLLRQKRQEAKATSKLNELRANLLTMLPHELRTPLNGILGVADLLEMGDTTAEELCQYAEILRESGERMLRLTTNFLLCAELQLQSEKSEKSPALFQGEPLCDAQEMAAVLEKRALAWGRPDDLHHQIAPGRATLPQQALSKVLDEVVDNAFKFSTAGDRVTVTGEAANGSYRWRIEDHGRSGTSTDMLESRGLFIQFDRKTNEQQGAGMGLHVVEKLCLNHGGKLKFLPTPGSGITAEILLPIASVETGSQTG